MSRDGGFQVGDRSSRTLYDVRLVRATRKAGLAVVVAWDAIVDASWEAGERVPFDDAIDTLPYDLGDSMSIKAALTSIGLLEDGLIREDSWTNWFGAAEDRREAKRERDRAYAAARQRAARLAGLATSDPAAFRRKLGEFLARRGFDYETIRDVVARLAGEFGVTEDGEDLG